MYSRILEGDTEAPLDFGVSGRLWHGVLVMYDRQTESYWTQIDGRAIDGKLTGARLEHVDSTFTSWSQWKELHPDTEVLWKPEDERTATESHYAEYFADPDRLFFDHLGEGLAGPEPKDIVFGVTLGDRSLAVTESLLTQDLVVQTVVDGIPVAFLYDPATLRARAVRAEFNGSPLLLSPIRDVPTTDSLRLSNGKHLDTDTLEPLRLDRAYWYAWARSHPGTRVLAD